MVAQPMECRWQPLDTFHQRLLVPSRLPLRMVGSLLMFSPSSPFPPLTPPSRLPLDFVGGVGVCFFLLALVCIFIDFLVGSGGRDP